ncbi:MAG: hypothetical protein AAB421_05285 [Patescibacteria group bacterium]
MKKFSPRPAAGAIAGQIFAVGGARAAYDYCVEVARGDLSDKIARGEFSPPRGFSPEAAQARVHALAWLARHKKRAA